MDKDPSSHLTPQVTYHPLSIYTSQTCRPGSGDGEVTVLVECAECRAHGRRAFSQCFMSEQMKDLLPKRTETVAGKLDGEPGGGILAPQDGVIPQPPCSPWQGVGEGDAFVQKWACYIENTYRASLYVTVLLKL